MVLLTILFSNNSFDRLSLTPRQNFDWYSGCHSELVEGLSIRKPSLIINLGY